MDSTPPPHEKLLRLKIASEIVLGNQASVAFSRAFYLEDLLIERIFKEFNELSDTSGRLLDQVTKFQEEVLQNESVSPDLSPMTESSIRCECSEMMQSLGFHHKPTLESFKQKIIQAKARRQAKSCLLEKLSTQNNNITSNFNSMTLAELLSQVHISEFSCFINDSDFGVLENFVEEWDTYRETASKDFVSFKRKLLEFGLEVEKSRKMREYTCDMILAQITQQKPQLYGTETLKRKGIFHKVSTLLRRQSQKDKEKDKLSLKYKEQDHDQSPEISKSLSVPETSSRMELEQTF